MRINYTKPQNPKTPKPREGELSSETIEKRDGIVRVCSIELVNLVNKRVESGDGERVSSVVQIV